MAVAFNSHFGGWFHSGSGLVPTRPCGSQGQVLQWQTYAKGWTLADSVVNVGLAGCAAMCFCHRVLAATTEPALVRPTWPWMDGRGAAMRLEGRGLAHCRRRLRAAWHGSTVRALDAASCVEDALRHHCSRTACNTVGPLVAARDDLFGKRRGQSAADPQHEGARDAVHA